MINTTFSSFLLILVASKIRLSQAQCYYPNGTLNPSSEYSLCNTGTTQMCCAQNRQNPDSCSKSGICFGGTNDDGSRALWRESCTDPTWKSPNCLKLCVYGDVQLTVCADLTVCCGQNNQTCCAAKEGIVFNPYMAYEDPTMNTTSTTSSTSTSAQSSSTTATSSTSTSTSSTSSSTPQPTNNTQQPTSGSSTKSSVGVGVGVGVGGALLVIAGVIALICLRRRRRRERTAAQVSQIPGPYYQDPPTLYDPIKGSPPAELPNSYSPNIAQLDTTSRTELGGAERTIHELPESRV